MRTPSPADGRRMAYLGAMTKRLKNSRPSHPLVGQFTKLCVKHGIFREEVALRSGLNPVTLKCWEKSGSMPNVANLEAALNVLEFGLGLWGEALPQANGTAHPTVAWLREQVDGLGWSHREFDRRVGLSLGMTSRWFKGEVAPRLDRVEAALKIFDKTLTIKPRPTFLL